MDYLSYLCEGLTKLLNEIVSEGGMNIFRRNPSVVFSSPGPASTDLHLCLCSKNLSDPDKGTFTCQTSESNFLVFRNPARLRVSFAIVGSSIQNSAALRCYDKLMTYFFDNRSIDPLISPSFSPYPALIEKLSSQKAEIKMTELPESSYRSFSSNFFFSFDYTALYHSGNSLREETKAKTRVIDFSNDPNQRSLI